MYFDLQQLDTFVAVANSGSFTRAAEQLFLTQPAVSKRISALEEHLQTPLFHRIGRRIVLTQAGQRLLPQAQSIMQQIQESKRILDELRGGVAGELTLASSHHIALHHLPKILRQFNDQYPEVDLNISFQDSEQACQDVLNGNLDFAIVTLPEAHSLPELVKVPLWSDPLFLVVGLNHPLREKKSWHSTQLSHYPAILPPEGSVTRKIIQEQLDMGDTPLKIKLTSVYLETIKTLVIAGLAWSVLPKTLLNDELHVLKAKPMHRQLGVVYHQKRHLSNAANAFLALLQANKK